MKTKQTTHPQKLGDRHPKKQRPRIHITTEVLHELIEEFDVADNTIRVALKFFTDSGTSKAIRKSAMERMRATMVRNTEFINEYDQD